MPSIIVTAQQQTAVIQIGYEPPVLRWRERRAAEQQQQQQSAIVRSANEASGIYHSVRHLQAAFCRPSPPSN